MGHAWYVLERENKRVVHCCSSVVSDSLRPHGLQPTRLPCPSPSPGVCSDSRPLSRWCHPQSAKSRQRKEKEIPPNLTLLQASHVYKEGKSTPPGRQAKILEVILEDFFPHSSSVETWPLFNPPTAIAGGQVNIRQMNLYHSRLQVPLFLCVSPYWPLLP